MRDLTPFFVTRQVFTGAGKVGAEAPVGRARPARSTSSRQRADFFETEVGLETTLKRPIINTRDEPHADPEKYRRLHVIVGDANMCEVATFLKVGTTAIVLKMIEDAFLPDLSLENPVRRCTRSRATSPARARSRWPTGASCRPCSSSGSTSSTRRSTSSARTTRPRTARSSSSGSPSYGALESDPLDAAPRARLGGEVPRCSRLTASGTASTWRDPKLRAIDLQYHDVRRDKGLYYRLEASGKVDRIATDAEVERAVWSRPEDTRAYFRGRCISKYPDAIAAASWDSLIVDTGADALQRIPMREPLRGTKQHVDGLLAQADTAAQLVDSSQS